MANKAMATKSFKVKKFLSLTLAFAVLMGLVSIRSVHAQDCRTLPSVIASAVSGANNAMEGHLNKHISNAMAPDIPNNSAMGATMYGPVADWDAAWDAYLMAHLEPFPNCGENHNNVVVHSGLDLQNIHAHTCTEVEPDNITQCRRMNAIVYDPVLHTVIFAWKGNRWIILTAYPRRL